MQCSLFHRFSLVGILFLLSAQFILAQGFEKKIPVPGVDFPQESMHRLLPNNHKLIANDRALLVVDQNAEVVWNTVLPDAHTIQELDYTANGDTLIAMALSEDDPSLQVFFHKYYFNSIGELINQQSTLITQNVLPNYFQAKLSRIALASDGHIGLFMAYDTIGTSSNADDANLIRFQEVDPAGNLSAVRNIDVGEFFRPLAADRLEDGSYALQLLVDTTLNGNNSLDNAFAALFHYYPDNDSLLQISNYSRVFLGQTGLSPLGSGIYGLGTANGNQRNLSLFDLNADTLVASVNLPRTPASAQYGFEGVFANTSGGYFLYESYFYSSSSTFKGLHVTHLSPQFEILNTFLTESQFSQYSPQNIYGLDLNDKPYFAAISTSQPPGIIPLELLYVQLDSSLNSFTNQISGTLYPEAAMGSCDADTLATPFQNWWIVAAPNDLLRDTLYALSDSDGQFSIRCDSGQYQVYAVPPNNYFGSCPPVTETLASANDTIQLNLMGQVLYDCSLPVISISATPFNECDLGYYLVKYSNEGSITEQQPKVIVEVDTFFVATNATPPWTQRIGNQLVFELDPLAPNEAGMIRIDGFMDCTEAIPGQTHCTQARIEPDTFCTPISPLWDGSSIEVSASCINDTAVFTITNVGADMAEPLSFVIIEDIVIHLGGDFELPAQASEIIIVPTQEGATYQIQADQSSNHPGSSMPTAGVEGCGNVDPNAFSLGLITQFAQDEGDPFVAIHCQASVANGQLGDLTNEDLDYRSSKADQRLADNLNPQDDSESNADVASEVTETPASVYLFQSPAGIGPDHLIDTAATVEYTIAFRNNPEAPRDIYQIEINGQLPNQFDITSLRNELTSLPFEFSVSSSGAFRYYLKSDTPIDIPAAFDGWGGFVQLSARLKSGLAAQTETCFQATINFNNEAVTVTNPRCLTVRKPVRYAVQTARNCIPDLDTVLLERSIDSISTNAFDSIVLNLLTTAGSFMYTTFLTATNGDTIAGVVVDITDGQLVIVDTLQSTAGCDSIVTYNITVSHLHEQQLASDGIRLFPNPAHDWFAIEIIDDRISGQLDQLQLTNAQGRNFPIQWAPQQIRSGTIIVFDISHLVAGWYLLSGKTDKNAWNKRLIIK